MSAGGSGVAANDFIESESDFELNDMQWRIWYASSRHLHDEAWVGNVIIIS